MRQKRWINTLTVASAAVLFGLVTGCAEKDLYDPDYGKDPLPDPSEYFGFETRGNVKLSVNYDAAGFTTLLEVYDKDPMEVVENTPVKKQGVEALFKIYTDENGKYEGNMNLPTAVEKIYLYTESWGLPRCVELSIKDGAVNFDMSRKSSNPKTKGATTRVQSFTGNAPYLINADHNLYSLCKWGQEGDLAFNGNDRYDPYINEGYITNKPKVGDEVMGSFVARMKSFFNPNSIPNVDNSRLERESKTTNITVKKDGTTLDVIFVNRDAAYNNTFGYYYYKTGEKVDINKIRKYIVFPNVAVASPYMESIGAAILHCGDQVRLKYYDEQGKASDKFPAGYTVGWFIYANGYISDPTGRDPQRDEINLEASLITSNTSPTQQKGGFVTVADKKSGKVIIGVEDGANKSYCDLLFYVNASPEEAIEDPDRPTVDPDDGKDPEKPDATEVTTGTLAFEDIWPTGGDYDMNDVIVEYKHTVSFNTKNVVTKIVDVFTPVHNGATYENAFAYQINEGQFGKVNSTNDIQIENKTSSIIVCPNAKQSINKVYTITRDFDEKSSFNKKDLAEYNPYIIVKYSAGQQRRTEVHLPKHKATALADLSLIGSGKDAYYIDRDGAYPFAIDIPILNFIPVTEKKTIDTEYQKFALWANSHGKECQEWYKKNK